MFILSLKLFLSQTGQIWQVWEHYFGKFIYKIYTHYFLLI